MKKALLIAAVVFFCLSSISFAGWVQKDYWVPETVVVNPAPYWCCVHGHWIYPSPYTTTQYVKRCYMCWEPDIIYREVYPVRDDPYYVTPSPYRVWSP